MSEEDQKKGQITIIAKNIKGKANGQILEESKKTRNTVNGKFYQGGKKGGVSNNKNRNRKPPLELRVLKVEGPFDEKNKKVDVIEKDKWYTYKVTQFNREPRKGELQNLRWGVKYDDGTLKDLEEVSCKGYKDITHKVLNNNNSSKLRIYAFFKAPNENASVEGKINTICNCDCKMPEENYPYSDNTFAKIKEIASLIKYYANLYNVPPVAIAGSIADEFNIINESRSGKLINWLQDDIVLNFMPNFAIEFDVYVGGTSKLNNATKHDLGIGNIKLETAKQLYDEYKTEFKNRSWDYKDIVNYIQSNDGTVHLAALVIKKAQKLLNTEIKSYCQCKQEAVLVTYYKQGDSYIVRFKNKRKTTPQIKIKPGEGCRVSLQRKKILNSLGIN